MATEALAKSVTTWVSDHKEVLITGALIVGTAALVVATGGIGAACVPGLIMATAGGAVLGAGGDIVGQMISNGSMDLSKIDWGSVALSGLAGGATGLLSATGAGPVAMGIMGGVSSGASEIYHQMQSGEDINWGQVAVRTLGGAVSGAVLGNVGSQTASGAKEIAKNAGKVFLANGGVSFAENLTYNLMGGEDLGTAAKQASLSALISGGTSAGFYALGQAGKSMCFVEGTMVLTAAGLVAIESIAVGDMVIATDPEIGETAEKEVKNTFVNETEELAHVFVDGEEIVCTPGHKFYAPEKGWTSAIKLRAGDHLQLVNGEYVTVEKVQHELLEEPVKVYNFEVDDFHTYYVGTDVQVLVHNEGCAKTNNGLQNATQDEINTAEPLVQERISEIKSVMTPEEAKRTTYSVAVVKNPDGTYETLVAAAGKDGYVRPAVKGNDTVVRDKVSVANRSNRLNDAEQTILRSANANNQEVLAIGATRPVCKFCQQALFDNGLEERIVTNLKG